MSFAVSVVRRFSQLRRLAGAAVAVALLAAGTAAAATNVDLGVSAYTWTPDPVVHSGTSTFTVTVTNYDETATADTLTLLVDLPSNVDFTGQTAPTGCAFNLGASPQTLTCTQATLAALGTWTVNFNGVGQTPSAQTTTATVSSSTNTDPNTDNDSLTKNTTVVSGADLTITKTGPSGCSPCNSTAGSTISFTLHVANNGPDAATTFRVTDNLPATTDFTYQSASGSGWSCSVAGTTVTCDYAGAHVASGSAAPDITLTGRIITSAGTITNGASVASTDSATGDPVAGNNGPSQVVVNVAAGTDLRANKTMVSTTTGLTTYATGEAVTLTLSATNQGTQNATGVTLTDTVPADFTLGTLPSGCSAVGQAVTCTVGALGSGATSTIFTIPLTVVGAAGNNGTNTANVSRSTPAGGANTPASVNYSITAPFAHLTLVKTKTPNLVPAGGNITNTITVTNSTSSTSAATGTIRVTDALDSNETFVSFSGSGWSCSGVSVGSTGTVTCDYASANLARGASLPVLTIITQAAGSYLGTISNTACTGLSASSPHTPADNSTTGNCQTKSVTGSNRQVDLAVTKSASIAAPTHILITDNSVTYTLTVSNAGPDVAPTVTVSDPLPGYYSGDAGTTGGSAVITGAVGGESCSFGSTVTCTLLNVASGSPRTITITLNRPFGDGSLTNTASVSSPDAIDTNSGNNTGSASIIVDPIADVAVTNIATAPNPVKVGVQLTYTTSIKNNGPSTAAGVVLRQVIDPTRMGTPTNISLTGTGGSCSYVSSFSGAPYAGQAGIECTGFTLTNGESRQLTFKVIPVYPYPDPLDATYTSNATISTTTTESDAPGYANNSGSGTVTVTTKAIDLSVTDNDPGYDPVAFGDSIIYQVVAQNNGPSQATGFKLTVTPTPPGQGAQSNPYTMSYNAGGSTLPGSATCSQPGGAGTAVVCYLGADQAHSVQAASTSATFQLKFDTGPLTNTPPSSVTYKTTASVESYETGASPFAGDTLAGNNSVTETTTVLPKTDLQVISKSVSMPTVDLNEEFNYVLVVGNDGPSSASGVQVTDALPAGLVRTGTAITVSAGSGVGTLTLNSCSGPAAGANGTVTCNLGTLPAGGGSVGGDTTKRVTITIPVRAAYQSSGTYSFTFGTNITNTASIAPLPNTSIDPTAGNNSASATMQVRKNSIAGTVYTDNNLNNALDTGEGIASVTLTLTGTDSYGNTWLSSGGTYPALTATTASDGTFTFDKLPPGTWQVVETQPSGYSDHFETAGTAGGTVPAATCNGTANCANSAAANTISAIALPADTATAATGYLFREYKQATISGTVYSDADNNGVKGGSETGISGVTLTLTGTDYAGQSVNTTTTSNASGAYTFTVAPADATGYTVTETQPASYLPGITSAGTASGTNSAAGSVSGGTTGNAIAGIKVYSNGASPNNNFGELQPATLSGYVFIDSLPATPDAQRDGTNETAGLTGVTMTLTGTDDLGAAVNTTTTSGVGGLYSFTSLRPGTYTVTETTPPVGLTHTGAQAGSKGGTIAGTVRTAGTGVTGAGNTAISAITLVANDSATGYNFGESGQGLMGSVYVDLNGNGVHDGGEPGIPGVSVTLSGTTLGGQNVCAAISPNPCTLTTDSSGQYRFIGLPASDATGYTLTEQSQSSAPLTNYGDGQEHLGTGLASPGTAGNDVFTGIVLPVGGIGANYDYGELSAKLAGTVYYDANDNGAKDGSDTGLAGITVALSGNTASGSNVCTWLTAQGLSCSTTTASDGTFSWNGLPASDATGYTLTETQPVDYADRSNTAGTGCGTASCGTAGVSGGNSQFTALKLGAGANAAGYLFGEKTGAVSGYVYLDANNNGAKDGGETGIASVALTLTGTTASGAAVSLNATTAADGSYSFSGLKNANAAGYTITEAQPASYLDGKLGNGKVNGVACATCDVTVANVISKIPLDASKTFIDYDFGELQAAGISGSVYLDANDNGAQDAGDSGIAGVTVALTGTNDLGAAVNLSTTTDASGNYSFANLRPSNGSGYTITETQPVDYADRSNTVGTGGGTAGSNVFTGVVLASGTSATGYLFGEKAGSVAGSVYLDANNNGTKDGGETGIAGVTLTLTGTSQSGVAVSLTATTAADGSYRFNGLRKANAAGYTITETQPASYLDGKQSKGLQNGAACAVCDISVANVVSKIPVVAGTTFTAYDFGELQAASVSGSVYLDANDNGAQDAGDSGIAGVTVALTGTNDLGAAVNLSTTTDASGNYSFVGLRPSNGSGYTVTETQPVDYADRSNTLGNGGGTAGTNVFTGIVLASGASATGYLFGEKAGNVTGSVYYDANNNGTRDSGETGIAGVTLTLTGTSQSGAAVSLTVTTAADGSYRFANLRKANAAGYTITETQPASYLDGKQSKGLENGAACAACNVSVANVISGIPVVAGTTFTAFDFGELQAASVSGSVYLDANDNGVKDAGDSGIAGVTLTLTGTNDLGAAVNLSTTTDASGNYSFTGLRPSNASGYTVTETQPVDYADRSSTLGSAGGTAGTNVFTGVVLASGASATGYLFGEKMGGIAGYVYADANNNGVKDSGETGIANVTLTLTGNTASGTQVSLTATTAADGSYHFSGLKNADAAGYTITETQPAAYLDGKQSRGWVSGAACAVCDISVANVIGKIPFDGSKTFSGFNFGEVSGGSLSGTVYIDANDNGAQDAGEAGIAGVTLTLTGNDDRGAAVNSTVTSAADGTFVFGGLRPSDATGYTITETQPAGYLDGRETAGTGAASAGTVDNSVFDAQPAHNRITGIVLVGQAGINYLFGERGGSLHGFVYVDANDNGAKDAPEAPLSGVRIYLSGTTSANADVCTVIPSCTSTTDAAGVFTFVVPPGTYRLDEEQADVKGYTDPATHAAQTLTDGRETAGVSGGTVDNSGFGNNAGYNMIGAIGVSAATLAANNGDLGGYLFGERVSNAPATLKPPVVSGYVYLDTSHTRVRGLAVPDERVAGWTVTLTAVRSDGSTETICSVQTDETGFYHLDNLSCQAAGFPQWINGLPTTGSAAPGGLTYQSFSIAFSNPGVNGVNTMPQSGGGSGTVDAANDRIAAIRLNPGDDIVEQNLPLDPSGVVYDAVSRTPVANAVVSLLEGGIAVPPACLVSGQNPVVTGTNGFYEFLLVLGPSCPLTAGNHAFTLAVTPPGGYAPGVSTMIPPTAGPLVPTLGGVEPIQVQNGPPANADATTYYLSLALTLTGNPATSSSNIVNNHIPVDPVRVGLILVTKTTPLLNVSRGDLVPYTITAANTVGMTLANIEVVDHLPPGFRYRSGSATLDGLPAEPVAQGRNLVWRNQTFAGNAKKTIKMILVVGSGVSEGEYVNQAWAANDLTTGVESNIAAATVRVIPDPDFDCTDIIGKVFDDKNANGYQDQGEPGIANVRLATPRGLLVTTDAEGRFHLTCADVPQEDHGSNFVMKLDERTLPSGYRLTTENPRDVRATRGKMAKLNFGATVHRVVRLELNAAAFAAAGTDLLPEWNKRLGAVPDQLKGRPSVLRIAYALGRGEDAALARARLDAVAQHIRGLWRGEEDSGRESESRNPLVVETELEGAQ